MLSCWVLSRFLVLTNDKIRYCPTENIRAIAAKIVTLEAGEPIKAETLTIDVSTIKTIITKETKMKIPLEPITPCI